MRVRIMSIVVCFVFIASFFCLAGAEEAKEAKEVKHEFIGAKKCSMCHKKSGIAESWKASKHATAWDDLSAEEQKNEALLPYYTTGTDKKGTLLTGIQCEACHGAGSDYKTKKVMQDQEAAIAAGMVIADEKTCMKCHNEKAPTKALAATAKGFDFKKMMAKGVHVMPTAATEEAEKKK